MSDDNTRPNFREIAKHMEGMIGDHSKRLEQKRQAQPQKFCDICEALYDYRDKPLIITNGDRPPAPTSGRCNPCKKVIKAGHVAIKLMGSVPKVAFIKKKGPLTDWPDINMIQDEELFDDIVRKIGGEDVDLSKYEEKLKNKTSEESPELPQ